MHTLKYAFLIACFGLCAVQAQETVAERQQKAIEVLRRLIAEENQRKASVVVTGSLAAPAAAMTPSVAAASSASQAWASHDTPDQARARQILRDAIAAREGGTVSGVMADPSFRQVVNTLEAPKPAKTKSGSAAKKKTAAEPAPVIPAGPKTKQEKLADLLSDYRADKISPPEYQQRRAQILAE